VPKKGDNFDAKSVIKKEPELKNIKTINEIIPKLSEFSGYYFDRDDSRHSKVFISAGVTSGIGSTSCPIPLQNPHEGKPASHRMNKNFSVRSNKVFTLNPESLFHKSGVSGSTNSLFMHPVQENKKKSLFDQSSVQINLDESSNLIEIFKKR
jgi:hypothetical protein